MNSPQSQPSSGGAARTSAADREEIFNVVRLERYFRDRLRFDEMEECYVPDAQIHVTWFKGDPAAFAEASRRQAQGKTRGRHFISPMWCEVSGDRALAESDAQIHVRGPFEGQEIDLTTDCRFMSRLVRTEGGWRLASFDCIYFKDRLDAIRPGQPSPVDWDFIARSRPSYCFMDFFLSHFGFNISQDLPGVDRPDLVEGLYARGHAWLAGG